MPKDKRIGMSRKSLLMLGAKVGILEHDPALKLPPLEDKVTLTGGVDLVAGDIVKSKQRDKTKSPYMVVQGVNHVDKQVELKAIDAPGSGNRQARRNNYAKQRKG